MSFKADNSELLLSDTPVPDIFITQYIQELSKKAICLYMWLLMIIGKDSFTLKDLDDYSVVSGEEKKEALAELISADLLLKKGEDNFVLADLKLREVDDYCKAQIAKGDTLEGAQMSKDEARDVLARSINKTFYLGKMANINYRLIDTCLYEYKFDSAVVYSLFEEARNKKSHYRINFLQKLAEEWYKKGYTTPDKLKKMFDARSEIDNVIKLMGKLTRTHLDGLAIEMIENWVLNYGYKADMAEYAYRCNNFRKTILFKHVDEKLKEWYLADIKSIDQASVYENKRHEENKLKSSRKWSSGNSWKTGSEMGVLEETAPSAEVKKEADDSADNDEILNLFGGMDADN